MLQLQVGLHTMQRIVPNERSPSASLLARAASRFRLRGMAYAVGLILVGTIAGFAIAETWVRTSKWTPPLQIVRGYGVHLQDGVPLWEKSTSRHNRDCVEQHPERIRILFFGNSITYGIGLKASQVFTAALQDRLNALRPSPGFCVLNFAQPGFAFQQKYAVARTEVARYRPALIMWEDWVEWQGYRMIGDAAYGTRDLAVRPDGFVGFAIAPDFLNRVLLPPLAHLRVPGARLRQPRNRSAQRVGRVRQ